MTDQHHFATGLEDRHSKSPHAGRSWSRRRRAATENQSSRQVHPSVKDAQTKALIAKLELTLSGLQIDIQNALKDAEFPDPTHFAFPIFVRMLIARRDNIQATIAVLSQCP